jgi:hypothetical protein
VPKRVAEITDCTVVYVVCAFDWFSTRKSVQPLMYMRQFAVISVTCVYHTAYEIASRRFRSSEM